MDTLDNIITDLTSIAKDKKYEGPTVDAMVYLLANGIYKNNLNAVTAVLEASSSRCRLLNSAIQHAMDQGYSVNRGTNQHIIIKNLLPVAKKEVKKYDQALKINGLCLYYANDYQLETKASEIEFIVGEEILEEELTVQGSDNQLCLMSQKTGYSQELDIYNSDGERLEYTELRRQVLGTYYTNSDKDLYWLLTAPDYGVEFYRYTRNNNSSYAKFDSNSVFKIKGVKYTDKTIAPESIKTIPGFKTKVSDNGTGTEISQVGCRTRNENISEIYLNSLKTSNSDFMIRTTNDIDRSVLAISNTGVTGALSRFYPTLDGFKDTNYGPDAGTIYTVEGEYEYSREISYGDLDSLFPGLCIFVTGTPDKTSVKNIRNGLVPSYYTTDTVFLFKTDPIHVVVRVDITYRSIINTNEMSNKIYNQYNNVLGAYLSPTLVTSLIAIDGVTEDIVVKLERLGVDGYVYVDDINCKPWEFMDLEVIITAKTSTRVTRY